MSWFSKWQAAAAVLLSTSLSPAFADIPASERAVLQALYTSTNGANWVAKTGWETPGSTVCTGNGPGAWFGITCGANDGTNDHIVAIRLPDNKLSGPLPALAGLTELRGFIAFSTNGDGSSTLTSLPPDLASLTSLRNFSVAGNGPGLTGTIPSLSALTNLETFRVNFNGLTGSLPSLSGLTNLTIFLAQNNQLSGTIPDLTGLKLTSFMVGNNRLTGSPPTAPATLVANESSLCTNPLSKPYADSPAWNTATGSTPWWRACDTASVASTTPVPTLSEWALLLLGGLLAAVVALRRNGRA
ncbi:IPTL-CTERM sorting domain-containing protein (plasmid) [Diaphorobacter sp. HDW4B]|uniref:leucine-rich repeat domain-containing protein n=1 Tax=Diaphorobacter sp. HDW4B TaxID=2714925 RepID=UPI00140AAFA4|nr:IPTL-CTERM sorting domain-containing protein [Diaphorobacter sp. HDW4B]QIL74344.1 IPTL-CTERM sorting domain-containing protein [Diaphorobacter sp. HDW4B]